MPGAQTEVSPLARGRGDKRRRTLPFVWVKVELFKQRQVVLLNLRE